MKRLYPLLVILGAAFALTPCAAQACVPMPPPPMTPGETQAAYDQRVSQWSANLAKYEADEFDKRVRGYWDSADAVVLARVVRTAPIDTGGYRLRLSSVERLKGTGRKTFDLDMSPPPPCGPIDMATKGDMVVLYVPAKTSGLGQPFWIRPKAIRDPRVTALLPTGTK